jgi:hypothetical protein
LGWFGIPELNFNVLLMLQRPLLITRRPRLAAQSRYERT